MTFIFLSKPPKAKIVAKMAKVVETSVVERPRVDVEPRSRIGNSILETYMGLRSFEPHDSALGRNDANMFLHILCTQDIKGVKSSYRHRG